MFEERPTKLEIPNSIPIGGSVDGMGDLDNAPMPPMDADDTGGEDPNGMDMPQGTDEMGGPMDVGSQNGIDDMGGMPQGPEGAEDDELMDIINKLSIEDKAAVTKYAKSMANDSMPQGGDMPTESRSFMKRIIDEVMNDVLDNNEGTKRDEKKMPKSYKDMEMPFKSPF